MMNQHLERNKHTSFKLFLLKIDYFNNNKNANKALENETWHETTISTTSTANFQG